MTARYERVKNQYCRNIVAAAEGRMTDTSTQVTDVTTEESANDQILPQGDGPQQQ
jgi:hypothetical protein